LKTFFIPVHEGSFSAPFIIYVHGAFAFAWITLFAAQTFLIHFKNYRIHKTLGKVGFFIAVGVAVTMLPAGLYEVKSELNDGAGETSYSFIVGVCTAAILFLTLVAFAIIYRRNSETHKHLMLLATIVVLYPAWFRFQHYFPSVPRPDIWFSFVLPYSFIVMAWIRDKRVNGKVHRVLLYTGLFIIIEQGFEVFAFDSPYWRALGKGIYTLLA